MKIDILKPQIFEQDSIISGVTKANKERFSKGFSIFPGQILSDDDVEVFRKMLPINIGVKRDELIFQKQTHSDTIFKIDEIPNEQILSDGIITNIKGVVLNVTIADCCGVLIFDPSSSSIAAIHSGWRGTHLNITGKGIDEMLNEYNAKPQTMQVFLSPAASMANYEVGGEVAELFPSSVVEKRNGKYYLDIRLRIKQQLLEKCVLDENIEMSHICTIADTQYHSFRRDKEKSGRMSAFIGMR